MILQDLENLSDEEKVANFEVLLDYTKELQKKHLENLVLRHRMKDTNKKYLEEQEKILKQEVEDEIKKAIARGELPKGKKHRNMGKKLTRIIKTKNGTSKKGNN
jgi:hypothetical protein